MRSAERGIFFAGVDGKGMAKDVVVFARGEDRSEWGDLPWPLGNALAGAVLTAFKVPSLPKKAPVLGIRRDWSGAGTKRSHNPNGGKTEPY